MTARLAPLAGAVATARSERIAVFAGTVERVTRHNRGGPRLLAGESVVVAVTSRGARPLLIELGPLSALRLASALIAACPRDGWADAPVYRPEDMSTNDGLGA